MENGNWKMEVGKWKLENGNRKREVAWQLSATVGFWLLQAACTVSLALCSGRVVPCIITVQVYTYSQELIREGASNSTL